MESSSLTNRRFFFSIGRSEELNLAAMLRSAGFQVVTLFDEYGEAESKIADRAIILDCGLKGRALLTGDQDLVHAWAREIAEAAIAVFVTTNNNERPETVGTQNHWRMGRHSAGAKTERKTVHGKNRGDWPHNPG
jgi:hypothetical protein